MAIIGFIVLVLLGLSLAFCAVMLFAVGSHFGGGDGEWLFSAILAGLVLWTVCHWAPFSVTFVGEVASPVGAAR